jgi:hypothetical protein
VMSPQCIRGSLLLIAVAAFVLTVRGQHNSQSESRGRRQYFLAADRWPSCAFTINRVSNQGSCHGCWALAPAETLHNRLCIALVEARDAALKQEHPQGEDFIIGDPEKDDDDTNQIRKRQEAFLGMARLATNASSYSSTSARDGLDFLQVHRVSSLDVLSCCPYNRRLIGCSIGGQSSSVWRFFEDFGFVWAADDASVSAGHHLGLEILLASSSNDSLPSNAEEQMYYREKSCRHHREEQGKRLTEASFCGIGSRSGLVPPPCTDWSIKKSVETDAETVTRNSASWSSTPTRLAVRRFKLPPVRAMGFPSSAAMERELVSRGPVQAVMRAFPMLATYNLVSERWGLRTVKEGDAGTGFKEEGRKKILVYKCDEKKWRRRRSAFPGSLSTIGRRHAVRIVGFGTADETALILPPKEAFFGFPVSSTDSRHSWQQPEASKLRNVARGRRIQRRVELQRAVFPDSVVPHHDKADFSGSTGPENSRASEPSIAEPWEITAWDVAGTDNNHSVKFWIVASTWGSDFGHGGILYVEQGPHDCGISSTAVAP